MNAEPTPTQLMEAIVDLKDAMLMGFGRVERRLDEHDRQFEILNRRLGRIETRVEDLVHRISA